MFTEIVFEATHEYADSLTDCLLAAGALSATLEDADAGLADEHPLFGEPGGEPLVGSWNRSRIVALFDGRIDAESAVAEACRAAGLESVPKLVRRDVASEDWVSKTQAQFEPLHIGKRIWIVPSWHQTPPAAQDPAAIVLRLDPGLAFGTGSHPTTRLCLEWLEAHLKAGASVIDYGCGSGILAIAAKKLGAGRVVGIDIDDQAILASVENAALNECEIELISASHFSSAHFSSARFSSPHFSSPHFSSQSLPAPSDVVIANILSNPLKVLAPLLCGLVAPGGSLVLSGVLRRQAEEVAEAYAPLITLDVWRADEDWVCLHGTKTVIAPTNSREADGNQKGGSRRMTLATRCPACETIFRVTTRDATAQSGTVRCGVCGEVFNALDSLVPAEDLAKRPDARPNVDADQAAPSAGEVDESSGLPTTGVAEAAEKEARPHDSADSGNAFPIDQPPQSPDSLDSLEDAHSTASTGPTEPAAQDHHEPGSERGSEREFDIFDPLFTAAETSTHPHPYPPRSTSSGQALEGEGALARGVESPPDAVAPSAEAERPKVGGPTFMDYQPSGLSPRKRGIFALLSVLAALALALQANYFWRDRLAVHFPWTRPMLVRACLVLNCRVELPMQIDLLSIESSELQGVPAADESYTFRALLRNRSRTGVRYPALELTLTDALDRTVVRRVLAPPQYLRGTLGDTLPAPAATPSGSGLGPNSELPIKISFDVPGEKIIGYRVALFYP